MEDQHHSVLTELIRAIEDLPPAPVSEPERDPRLIALRSLFQKCREDLDRASLIEYTANQGKVVARKAFLVTRSRLEQLETELCVESVIPDEKAV